MHSKQRKKIAIITGASRGIGAATAKLFAAHGYRVCINYKKNSAAAKSVKADIVKAGGECIIVQGDVSIESDVLRLFSTVDKELGPLSVLINNAAIMLPQSRLIDMSAERIGLMLRTNITSYFMCCKEAVKRMSTQHGGHGGTIVNVSSGAAKTGSPCEYIDYAATKGAIDTLTKGLALEVAEEGIRVNAVRPGLIYTDMHADGGEPSRVDRLAPKIPLKRGGKCDEVAEAILWLASEKSSFTTGMLVDVAGGL